MHIPPRHWSELDLFGTAFDEPATVHRKIPENLQLPIRPAYRTFLHRPDISHPHEQFTRSLGKARIDHEKVPDDAPLFRLENHPATALQRLSICSLKLNENTRGSGFIPIEK